MKPAVAADVKSKPIRAGRQRVEASTRRSPQGETVLRVDAEKIDNVLNLVGELIIGKSMLQQVMTDYALRSPKDALRARFGRCHGLSGTGAE